MSAAVKRDRALVDQFKSICFAGISSKVSLVGCVCQAVEICRYPQLLVLIGLEGRGLHCSPSPGRLVCFFWAWEGVVLST